MSVEQLIFTDQPQGKGLNPNASGYQIKACSAELPARAREQLSSICMHYGDTVYRSAPYAAIDKETEWRAHTASLDRVPPEILAEFPAIWTYDQVGDDLFALTRVLYTGLTHDGRSGNFVAHALVFPPDELAGLAYNPLGLSSSQLFETDTADGETTLPALPDLGGGSAQKDQAARFELLRQEPYSTYLAAMISALCTATPAKRPLLVCLPDWKLAAPFVQALLGVLPPSARCRTTICTYESDRNWTVPDRSGRVTGLAAAHHLLVLCGSDHRLNLRPDEVQSTYAVFNFTENQFSELPVIPYATFAAACLTGGQFQKLFDYQSLIDQLGLGRAVDVWSKLVPLGSLPDSQPRADTLVQALQTLHDIDMPTTRAELLFPLILPNVDLVAQSTEITDLSALKSELSALAGKTVAQAGPEFAAVLQANLCDRIRQAFTEGHIRTVDVLLQACGQERDAILLDLLIKSASAAGTVVSQSPMADREQLAKLYLQGLSLLSKFPEAASEQNKLLVATFDAAHQANQVDATWKQIGEVLVQKQLDGEWNKDKEQLARSLLTHVPGDNCPEGNLWLNLKLVEKTSPRGDRLLASLVELAHAASRLPDSTKVVADLLRMVGEQFPEPEQATVALGRMVQAAKDTPAGTALLARYQETMKQVPANRQNAVYRRLVEANAITLVFQELFTQVLPWDPKESPGKLQRWLDMLKASSGATDKLCQEVADQLKKSGDVKMFTTLAGIMLSKQAGASGTGFGALYEAMLGVLPFDGDSADWARNLAAPPANLSQAAVLRLRIFKFMSTVEGQAGQPDWSTLKFPRTDAAWATDVRSLSAPDKLKIQEWCLDTFEEVGILIPEEAIGLATVLEPLTQSPELIADSFVYLVEGKDRVTKVLVATAFARALLEGKKPSDAWTNVIRAIVNRLDETNRHLFEKHLKSRFGRRDEKYTARLQLIFPDADTAAAKGQTVKGQPAPASSADKRETGTQSVVDVAKNALHSLRGRFAPPAASDPKAQPDDKKDDKKQEKPDKK